MKPPVEKIMSSISLIAIIVHPTYCKEGTEFFTPNEFSQQLAYMHHPPGKMIAPHVHNPVSRQVQYTQEILILKRGKLRVDFYDDQRQYLESRILSAGDIILLVTGGHGFEVLEDLEMFEVKQGPYLGDQDKTRFSGVEPKHILLKGES